jgi:hypothetical protein
MEGLSPFSVLLAFVKRRVDGSEGGGISSDRCASFGLCGDAWRYKGSPAGQNGLRFPMVTSSTDPSSLSSFPTATGSPALPNAHASSALSQWRR